MENNSKNVLSSTLIAPQENSYVIFIKDEVIQGSNPNVKILPLPNAESSHIDDDNDEIISLVKFCSVCFLITFCTPLITCDLYFAYNDDTCVPLSADIKRYLEVSGYFGLTVLTLLTLGICCLPARNENLDPITVGVCILKTFSLLLFAFIFLWNIYGAVAFWGTVYEEGTCGKIVSTYLFISLIIKNVSGLIELAKIKRTRRM